MDFLENQKNYDLPMTPYSQNNLLRWPGTCKEAALLLAAIPNFKTSSSLFEILYVEDSPL